MVSQQEECAVFEQADPVVEEDQQVQQQPRYHVILWDDEAHTYEYVIRMLQSLFAHPVEKGYELASQVDRHGQVICLTTTMEHAELKRDQIHAFGKDIMIGNCQGSMSASIEPES
ncbi:MAG: ATP-dependent Clp protease adaptor ClpS [Pirellulaceae bacterium]